MLGRPSATLGDANFQSQEASPADSCTKDMLMVGKSRSQGAGMSAEIVKKTKMLPGKGKDGRER